MTLTGIIQKYEELKVKYGWQEDSLTRCNTVQGFITNKGRFVDRKEAFQIALAAGQIGEDAGVNKELFSEVLGDWICTGLFRKL